MTNSKINKLLDFQIFPSNAFWAMGAAVLVYGFYAYWQPIYTYTLLDPRFDAHQYARAYAYFAGQAAQYEVKFPFNARILGPWLAAHWPASNAAEAFRWVNGLFLVLTTGVLVSVWQQLKLRKSLIVIGLFWGLLHWKGPLRMYLPDPIAVDVPLYFFEAVWLYLVVQVLQKKTFRWQHGVLLLAVGVLGTLQKEVFLVVIGVSWGFLFFKSLTPQFPLQNGEGRSLRHYWFLGCWVVGILVHFWADWAFAPTMPSWRHWGALTLLRGLKRYAVEPHLWLQLPISWLVAFGGFWWGLWWRNHKSAVAQYLQIMTFIWLLLSVLGGGDTTRILVNGLPFVLTFLLLRLQTATPRYDWVVLLASLPLMRLWQLEPDLGLFPEKLHDWCVECWHWPENWPYWLYLLVILAIYPYFLRGLRTVDGHKTDKV